MKVKNALLLMAIPALSLITIAYVYFTSHEAMIDCDATVSMEMGSDVFKGNYLFYIRKDYTGTVYITGHIVKDGKSYAISRTFNVKLELLSEEGKLYRLTVINRSFYSNDIFAQKEDNTSRLWVICNIKSIENSFQVLRIQPVTNHGKMFLLSNLHTPIMLCQAPQHNG